MGRQNLRATRHNLWASILRRSRISAAQALEEGGNRSPSLRIEAQRISDDATTGDVAVFGVCHPWTTRVDSSIEACPDFWNGRGMGWAAPFVSIVRQRRVYRPAVMAGSSTVQWAFV